MMPLLPNSKTQDCAALTSNSDAAAPSPAQRDRAPLLPFVASHPDTLCAPLGVTKSP
jgi:hypothetical protein